MFVGALGVTLGSKLKEAFGKDFSIRVNKIYCFRI